MRITSKGQVTIPADIRKQAGLLPHTEVEFLYDGQTVRLVRAGKAKGMTRGRRIVDRLARTATGGMTTEQIMRLTRAE